MWVIVDEWKETRSIDLRLMASTSRAWRLVRHTDSTQVDAMTSMLLHTLHGYYTASVDFTDTRLASGSVTLYQAVKPSSIQQLPLYPLPFALVPRPTAHTAPQPRVHSPSTRLRICTATLCLFLYPQRYLPLSFFPLVFSARVRNL
jgi:hypothetical protein